MGEVGKIRKKHKLFVKPKLKRWNLYAKSNRGYSFLRKRRKKKKSEARISNTERCGKLAKRMEIRKTKRRSTS